MRPRDPGEKMNADDWTMTHSTPPSYRQSRTIARPVASDFLPGDSVCAMARTYGLHIWRSSIFQETNLSPMKILQQPFRFSKITSPSRNSVNTRLIGPAPNEEIYSGRFLRQYRLTYLFYSIA